MRTPVIFALMGLAFAAATPAMAEDAIDAQKIYRLKTCVACHGAKGQKPIQSYPALAGQNEKYLLNQMKDVKSGKRVSSVDAVTGHPFTEGMAAIMHIVNDDELKALAKYLSEQQPGKPKPPAEPITAEQTAAGQGKYKTLGCVACHGAAGKKALAPAYPILAGLNRDYLVRQMTDLRDGTRANGLSKLMLGVIKRADDAAIAAIADYLSQIDRTAK